MVPGCKTDSLTRLQLTILQGTANCASSSGQMRWREQRAANRLVNRLQCRLLLFCCCLLLLSLRLLWPRVQAHALCRHTRHTRHEQSPHSCPSC